MVIKTKKEYRLQIIYPAQFYSNGDRKICKAVGRTYSDASGMGFGERDMSFYFDTKKKADNACKRVEKQCKFITFCEVTAPEDW